MVKPPAVYIAGLLRATRAGRSPRRTGRWIADQAGQMLFHPPNVAGWDESRWLDTATFRGRWVAANNALGLERARSRPRQTAYDQAETPEAARRQGARVLGQSRRSQPTTRRAPALRGRGGALANERWKRRSYPILRQNALRILVATSPDLQTC